jgi:hypothetical protein
MLLLSFILCLFANIYRWAELADNTSLRTFKQLLKVNDYITIKYNIVWWLITLIIYLISFI